MMTKNPDLIFLGDRADLLIFSREEHGLEISMIQEALEVNFRVVSLLYFLFDKSRKLIKSSVSKYLARRGQGGQSQAVKYPLGFPDRRQNSLNLPHHNIVLNSVTKIQIFWLSNSN